MIIGIDLGTTNSLVGIWRDGAGELIPNALGSLLTPSAVSVGDDGTILVGIAARERLLTAPRHSVAAFKRYMGTSRRFTLGKHELRAEELSAWVLRSLKDDAEAYLGRPIGEAVITVPAYFNDAQRKATKAAGELAGLRVERLLNEPTAAALAYGLQEHVGEGKIIVLDLGGGTFDVSVMEMFDGVMEVRATAGDNFLGGEDFVEAIVERFIAVTGARSGIPPLSRPAPVHAALWRQAEVAKRALSDADSHEMELVHEGAALRWTLTREEFERLCARLLERIRVPIERALRDAAIHPDEIGSVVLAGGATRMPLFRRLATRLFRRLPVGHLDPEQVVARGAAVQAGLKMRDAALDDVVMTDVAPFTLGIEVAAVREGQVAATGLYLPVIERNTVIPASRSTQVHTVQDGQRRVQVRIFQGESRMVGDNIELGELAIKVPRRSAGEETIDVRFTYDVSGLLEVDTRVLSTGATDHILIEGRSGTLSGDQIKARLAVMARLKIHPRDQAENRALLARAERLYEERLGTTRERLGEWLEQYLVVLDRQDPGEIDAFRAQFLEYVNDIDVGFFS